MELPKIENKLEIKNQTNNGRAELYLHGTIRKAYPWEDLEDCISSKLVRRELNNLNGKDVDIHINSGGGDVFESIAICNNIKDYDGEVRIIVDSLAGSGASIIATAAKVYMYSNSMQMIHKAWTFTWGNADELREEADKLDKVDSAVSASYKNKFVGTDEELNNLLAAESWLTAEECIALGFADEIIDQNDEEETAENNIKETLFNKYKKDIKAKKEDNQQPDSKKSGLFNAFKKSSLGGIK